MKTYILLIVVPIVLLALAVTGIVLGVKMQKEDERPLYQKVQMAVEDEDANVGITALNHYLAIHPDSIPTRMQLARFYEERLNKPFEAVYHYNQVLLQEPSYAQDRDFIRWRNAARKRAVEQLIVQYPELLSDTLAKENVQLRSELREVRLQLDIAEGRIALSTPEKEEVEAVEEKEEENPSGVLPIVDYLGQPGVVIVEQEDPVEQVTPEPTVETTTKAVVTSEESSQNVEQLDYYIVGKGDTLGGIAYRLYGDVSKAKVIYQLNRTVLSSPDAIRIGMRLQLPIEGLKKSESSATSKKELPPIKPLTAEQLQKLRQAKGDKATTQVESSLDKELTPQSNDEEESE